MDDKLLKALRTCGVRLIKINKNTICLLPRPVIDIPSLLDINWFEYGIYPTSFRFNADIVITFLKANIFSRFSKKFKKLKDIYLFFKNEIKAFANREHFSVVLKEKEEEVIVYYLEDGKTKIQILKKE